MNYIQLCLILMIGLGQRCMKKAGFSINSHMLSIICISRGKTVSKIQAVKVLIQKTVYCSFKQLSNQKNQINSMGFFSWNTSLHMILSML